MLYCFTLDNRLNDDFLDGNFVNRFLRVDRKSVV